MHKRGTALLTVAVVGLGPIAVALSAEARPLPAPREVTVRLAPSGIQAPEVLKSGRYKIHVEAPRKAPALLQLVKPDRGYTRADLRRDTRRPQGGRRMLNNLRFFGGVEVRAGQTGALWETLYAGRYWLVGITARGGELPIRALRVHGTPSPSRFPRVSAEATGTGQGLRISRFAPAFGRMLIRNHSNDFDAVTAIPLKKGTTYAEFLRWLRHPQGDVPVRFGAARSTALLSPDAGYVLRYRLRPGHYVVVSLSTVMGAVASPEPKPRDVFRPLTITRPATAGSARVTTLRAADGFEATPGTGRRVERWLENPHRKAGPLVAALTRHAASPRT